MKHNYEELNLILDENTSQKKIYQPTSFWIKASQKIIREIEEFGVENFRKLDTPLGYFVPNYGVPANSFTEFIKNDIRIVIKNKGTNKQLLAMDEFISGYFHALSDYRVFLSSDDLDKKSFLKNFSEINYGNPIEQFEFDGKKYSRSSLNYILGICFLKKHLKNIEEIKTVLEIGGGFGSLGEILNGTKGLKYIDVDIPPISFIAWKYLNNIYSEKNIEPYVHKKEKIIIEELKPCSVFNSWDIEKLEGSIDLFVNFISFQEMEPDIVQNYLMHVKRLNPKWILLRNMREGKNKKQKSGQISVETPIRKNDYINMIQDKYSMIEANVFPYGYKTVDGFHSELLLFKRKHD
jgi:putative sugar O-methyltransferase